MIGSSDFRSRQTHKESHPKTGSHYKSGSDLSHTTAKHSLVPPAWIAASQTRMSMTLGIDSVLPLHAVAALLHSTVVYQSCTIKLKHQSTIFLPTSIIPGLLDLLQGYTDFEMPCVYTNKRIGDGCSFISDGEREVSEILVFSALSYGNTEDVQWQQICECRSAICHFERIWTARQVCSVESFIRFQSL